MTPDSVEALAHKVANIVGDQSAAALALKELQERKSKGEKVFISLVGQFWIVSTEFNGKGKP